MWEWFANLTVIIFSSLAMSYLARPPATWMNFGSIKLLTCNKYYESWPCNCLTFPELGCNTKFSHLHFCEESNLCLLFHEWTLRAHKKLKSFYQPQRRKTKREGGNLRGGLETETFPKTKRMFYKFWSVASVCCINCHNCIVIGYSKIPGILLASTWQEWWRSTGLTTPSCSPSSLAS